MENNIGAYFEIPVVDMERAIIFYQSLLGIELERGSIHEYEMAFFPYENNGAGISGALAKGDVYKPSFAGVFLYLKIDDIDIAISKAINLGSEVLLEKIEADSRFVAEIKDSEGNRICLKHDFLRSKRLNHSGSYGFFYLYVNEVGQKSDGYFFAPLGANLVTKKS